MIGDRAYDSDPLRERLVMSLVTFIGPPAAVSSSTGSTPRSCSGEASKSTSDAASSRTRPRGPAGNRCRIGAGDPWREAAGVLEAIDPLVPGQSYQALAKFGRDLFDTELVLRVERAADIAHERLLVTRGGHAAQAAGGRHGGFV